MTAPDDARIMTEEPTIFGHPRALYVLFFAEMWERFCYYGMRALLALYVVQQFHKPQAEASTSYGAFTALVYALGIFGGTIADRVLGYRRSIMLGGTIMAIGLFMLMVPTERMFLFGLATIIVGNGLFKPNISTLVGKLYKPGDPRRDGGFTIFYMGINIGATLAPLVCQWISEKMGTPGNPDYRYGFVAAGVGMLLGLVTFGLGTPLLRGHGKAPENRQSMGWFLPVIVGAALVVPVMYFLLGKADWTGYILFSFGGAMFLFLLYIAFSSEMITRQRMFVLVMLLVCNIVFWTAFEQAGNSLNFFAVQHIDPLSFHYHASVLDPTIPGDTGDRLWSMPAEWFQSVNAIFIVLLGPLFASLWVKLDRRGKNPSIPRKFGLGLLQVGLGFGLLVLAIRAVGPNGLVPFYILVGLYFIHTMGELCLSPVGLSMVTKLAPEKMVGMVMGSWFISIAMGNFLAGKVSEAAADKVAAVTEAGASAAGHTLQAAKCMAYGETFTVLMWAVIAVGVVLFLVAPFMNRWMHGVK